MHILCRFISTLIFKMLCWWLSVCTESSSRLNDLYVDDCFYGNTDHQNCWSPFDDFPELLRAVCVIHYLHKIFNWRYEIQSKVGGWKWWGKLWSLFHSCFAQILALVKQCDDRNDKTELRNCKTPRPSHRPRAPPISAKYDGKLNTGNSWMKVLTVGENVMEMVVVFPSISFSLISTVLNDVEVHGAGHSKKVS